PSYPDRLLTRAAFDSHPCVEKSIEEGRPRPPYFSFVPPRRRRHLPPGASPNSFDQIPIPIRVSARADPERLIQPFSVLVVDADERVGALHGEQPAGQRHSRALERLQETIGESLVVIPRYVAVERDLVQGKRNSLVVVLDRLLEKPDPLHAAEEQEVRVSGLEQPSDLSPPRIVEIAEMRLLREQLSNLAEDLKTFLHQRVTGGMLLRPDSSKKVSPGEGHKVNGLARP